MVQNIFDRIHNNVCIIFFKSSVSRIFRGSRKSLLGIAVNDTHTVQKKKRFSLNNT